MQTLTNRADSFRDEIGAVICLTLLGLALRLAAPLMSSFLFNDGGLFYSMIVDLQSNDLLLHTTSYNTADIPLTYPPLAFYLTTLIAKISGASVLDLLRILPAVFIGIILAILALVFILRLHNKTNTKNILFRSHAYQLLLRCTAISLQKKFQFE